ncbi:hypothetical protein [Fictibacillus sp. BK138]|uniref:hypothetical protein n=1 Tax=Fictibacillus sp. BK138 TaxID=2512121 RepID=UPI001F5FD829|nr:hypothetical protein [Fictibacillus sp. BK138]
MADLARTLVILKYGGMHSGMKPFKLNAVLYVRNLLAHKYLRSYRRSFHFSLDSLKEWMLPVTAARLSENLPDQEKERLVMLVKHHIENNALK